MVKLTLSFALLFGAFFLGTPTLSLAARGGGGGSRGGGGGGGSHGSVSTGGGSRGFSGGGGSRGFSGGSVGGGYGNRGYGGYGYRGYGGYGYRGYGFGLGLGFGFGYPWYGGYYGYGYPYYSSYYGYPAYDYGSDYGYYNDPGPVTYSQPAAQAPAPSVNVYTSQAPVAARPYQAPPPGRNADGSLTGNQSSMYLIALPDGSVQVAVAYWTENGNLHFVTRDKQQKSVPLSAIDQATTRQLNHERGVTMNLQ